MTNDENAAADNKRTDRPEVGRDKSVALCTWQ